MAIKRTGQIKRKAHTFLQARMLHQEPDGTIQDWSDRETFGLRTRFAEFAEELTVVQGCIDRLELLRTAVQGRKTIPTNQVRKLVEDLLDEHENLRDFMSCWSVFAEDLEQLPPLPQANDLKVRFV